MALSESSLNSEANILNNDKINITGEQIDWLKAAADIKPELLASDGQPRPPDVIQDASYLESTAGGSGVESAPVVDNDLPQSSISSLSMEARTTATPPVMPSPSTDSSESIQIIPRTPPRSPERFQIRPLGDLEAQTEEEVVAAVEEQAGFLRKLLTNTFTHDGAGWATNLLHAAGRDGTITFLTTGLREVIGRTGALDLRNKSDGTKVMASSVILGGLGLLNVASAVWEKANGLTNRTGSHRQGLDERHRSRLHQQREENLHTLAKLSTGGLLVVSGAVSSLTGGLSDLGNAAPLLIKATAYAGVRDGINTFVTLSDNRPAGRATSLAALAINMIAYAANQYLVNTLQGTGLSHSGTSSAAQSESLTEAFRHVAAFSAANALGEALDAVVYTTLMAFFDKAAQGLQQGLARRIEEGERMGLAGVKRLRLTAGLRIPNGHDILNKATGVMLPRASLFAIVFTLLSAMSKIGPRLGLNEKNSENLLNAVAGASIGLLYGLFVSTTMTLA
jgi:hypothetical protein